MKYSLLSILFVTITSISFSQDTIPISKIDTLIPFWGRNSLNLGEYENRIIPYGSKVPLYISINYKNKTLHNYEFFRVDSSTYLAYEYFRDQRPGRYDRLKSKGIKVLRDRITDSSVSGVVHIGRRENRYTREIHYYKEFSKEGEWEEYQDSVFHHTYWVGNYTHNKRTGLWKHFVYGMGELLLEEIDYDADSSKRIYTNNIITSVSIDSLKLMLMGKWKLVSCDASDEPKMFYFKCPLYYGHYGDDCKYNYYEFMSNNKFHRQHEPGDGCYKFREGCINGQWKITEKQGQRFIEINFINGQTWKLKIQYIDKEHNLVTDRQ
jgi:hypothetical protein